MKILYSTSPTAWAVKSTLLLASYSMMMASKCVENLIKIKGFKKVQLIASRLGENLGPAISTVVNLFLCQILNGCSIRDEALLKIVLISTLHCMMVKPKAVPDIQNVRTCRKISCSSFFA